MKKVILLVVTLIALLLRIWGADFGLPYLYHVDEPAYVRAAIALGKGDLHTKPYDPTGFANILYIEYAALYVVGRLLGVFHSLQGYREFYGDNITLFFLLSRYTSAILGAATIVPVYVLGKRVRSEMTGILAAIFLAVSFMHVRDSHYGVPDITMTFFVLLCIVLAVRALETQRMRDIVLAGIAGGLAIATKWIALPVLLSVLIISFPGIGSWRESNTHSIRLGSLAVSAAGPALGFAVGSPQILISPRLYWGKVLEELLKTKPESGIWQVDIVPGWWYYIKTLRYGVGVVLLVLGILGAFRYLVSIGRTRDRQNVMVFFFPVLYFLLMGANRHYAWRYALPLVPFLALFAAEAVVIGSTWARNWRLGPAMVWTAVLAVPAIVQPLSQSIRHDLLLTREDTRTVAKKWIETNIPEGAKVALDWPVFSPPLYGSWSLVPYSDRRYDITVIGERGAPRYPLDWYREQGFNYVVITSYVYNYRWARQDSDREKYYALLDQELDLVGMFTPYMDDSEPSSVPDEMYGPAIHLWERERPGPLIKIYKLG